MIDEEAFEPTFFEDDFQDEPTDPISFFSEEIDFSLQHTEKFQQWIKQVIDQHHCTLSLLNFIFCDDAYLLKLNIEFLQHDTLTDIITFPYQDPPRVEGDIFISIDRVRENAQAFGVSFSDELSRVIIHGVLHLCGFGDKSDSEKAIMRSKEEEAIRSLDVQQ